MKFWPLLLLFVLAACQPTAGISPTETPSSAAVTPQVLEVICSEGLMPVIRVLASTYQHINTATQIVVIERADQLAVQALKLNDADLIAVSWLPDSEETWATPFARDGLALIIHPQNGIPGLTTDQLKQLFQGQVEDWEPWGGLPGAPQIISREEASGDYAFFQQRVMRDARVALTGLLAPSSSAMLDLVSHDPLAIGYLSTSQLDGQVRALAIDGVPPAPETITANLYPLSRNLYLVTQGEPHTVARDFIQWILSAEGQRLVLDQGLLQAPQP